MPRPMVMFPLMLLGGASLAAAQPMKGPQSAAPEGPVDRTSQTEDVEFRNDLYERMTVPVRLSGTGPYRFLVDTGADRTAVSRELATKLKLAAGQKASLHSVSEMSTISTATVPDLQLTRRNVRVIDAAVLESANMGADGILGVDSLRAQRVLFDFEGQSMSVVPSKSIESVTEPGAIVITAQSRNGRLIITEARANGRPVTVVLDTGAQVSIGNSALRKQLLGKGLRDGSQRIELESVTGGKLMGDYLFVRELEMSGVQLSNLAIVFADAHTFKALKLERKPALLLGMNALRAFKRVSIDFANKTFRVVLPQRTENEIRMADRL